MQSVATRFCPVSLTDPRCQKLWMVNDTELLRKVAILYPDILPPHEWQQIEDHQDFIRDDAAYRRFGVENMVEEKYLQQEYWENESKFVTTRIRWDAMHILFLDQLARAAALSPPIHILDLGAWTGALSIQFANLFPRSIVHARDMVPEMKQAIEYTASKYARDSSQIVVEIGDHKEPPLRGPFTIVFLGEILEHVPDVADFIHTVEAACVNGAVIICTTPIEHPQDVEKRVHCRHFELEDLVERFGVKQEFNCFHLINNWHVFAWSVDKNIPVGEINWDRKLRKHGF